MLSGGCGGASMVLYRGVFVFFLSFSFFWVLEVFFLGMVCVCSFSLGFLYARVRALLLSLLAVVKREICVSSLPHVC